MRSIKVKSKLKPPQRKSTDISQATQTLVEVLTGIIFVTALECVVGMFIPCNHKAYILGTLLGAGSAAFFYLHLFYALNKALDKPEKEAVKYSNKQTVIRLILMGAVLAVSFTLYEHVSVIMSFVGMMSVKFAAYLQPITHKCINNLIKGR